MEMKKFLSYSKIYKIKAKNVYMKMRALNSK